MLCKNPPLAESELYLYFSNYSDYFVLIISSSIRWFFHDNPGVYDKQGGFVGVAM